MNSPKPPKNKPCGLNAKNAISCTKKMALGLGNLPSPKGGEKPRQNGTNSSPNPAAVSYASNA
jgi:hypothetical protein